MLEKLIRNDDLRPCNSPWASPIHVANKKGPETRRLTGDYRRLNSITKPDGYPIPNILDFNVNLHGTTVFTSINIKRVYHQILVREEDAQKTAIITPLGLYKYMLMPFGLRNTAQTFQRFVHGLFCDLPYVYAYIDDIFIAFVDYVSHEQQVHTMLNRLHK